MGQTSKVCGSICRILRFRFFQGLSASLFAQSDPFRKKEGGKKRAENTSFSGYSGRIKPNRRGDLVPFCATFSAKKGQEGNLSGLPGKKVFILHPSRNIIDIVCFGRSVSGLKTVTIF